MEITRLPKIDAGQTEESLRQIKSYIVRLDRALSMLLDNVGSDNLTPELNALLSQTEQGLFITVISVTAPFGNVPVGKYVYLVYNDAGQSGLIRLNGS